MPGTWILCSRKQSRTLNVIAVNRCEALGLTTLLAALSLLPESVRNLANKNFELLKADPHHPSLHLKKVGELWSVRVGAHYRALGLARLMKSFGFGSAHTQTTTSSFNRAEQLEQPT